MPPSTAPYVIGKLGSYDTPTVARIDAHLRGLRNRLAPGITSKDRIRIWDDVNALLEARAALTPTGAPQ